MNKEPDKFIVNKYDKHNFVNMQVNPHIPNDIVSTMTF